MNPTPPGEKAPLSEEAARLVAALEEGMRNAAEGMRNAAEAMGKTVRQMNEEVVLDLVAQQMRDAGRDAAVLFDGNDAVGVYAFPAAKGGMAGLGLVVTLNAYNAAPQPDSQCVLDLTGVKRQPRHPKRASGAERRKRRRERGAARRALMRARRLWTCAWGEDVVALSEDRLYFHSTGDTMVRCAADLYARWRVR